MNTIVNSPKITVRPFKLSDVDDLWEFVADKRISEYSPWFTFKSKDDVLSFIKNVCIPHPYFRSICIDDRSIGFIIFTPLSGDRKCVAEFGGAVSPKYWGRGIGTKAMRVALANAFKTFPDVVRMQTVADVENKAVQRVLEKLGCLREGVLRKYMYHEGKAKDCVMFSLLSTDVVTGRNKLIRSSL